ncbi:porin [Methylocella silvestris BL2]|uniref:Porin n=1 Tax=Methylocella silvestris (strain DSM 15510 / CIP 108128 / LMG 27833 / NCIMB 13906 / BL2) TaxID=395965 RepID=B8EPB7_METSB|nr:porin [Methylocella silvestris]ACK49705.1 porin [Methylocella silvestris BL2]
MRMFKGLLLGSAAALVSVAGAKAADLPTRQAAPIEYVRICDTYGSGFFYIPGTDTCLKVGGLVLGEIRSYDAGYSISPLGATGTASGLGVPGLSAASAVNPFTTAPTAGSTIRTGAGGATAFGYVPSSTQYANARTRDSYGWASLGRIELDARTGTPWGTLRSFIRVDSFVGTGQANTGSIQTSSSFTTGNYTNVVNSAVRETTIVSKAFIQFAGLTAGRAQSMFDFYANAYNYQNISGSNATTQLLAYTYSFGGGFSSTLSVEDVSARQAGVGSTVTGTVSTGPGLGAGGAAVAGFGGIAGTTFTGNPAGMRLPDIVGNVRVDQPWGAAQLSAAGHQVRASLFSSTAGAGTYGFPAATDNAYGWAIQGGLQLNADYLSPGDKLWLQAAYEKGAVSYIWGNNLASSYGTVNGLRFQGSGFTPSDTSAGWNSNIYDCVFTFSGACEQQSGWSIVGAYKHYWLPSLASAVYGSYTQINYSNNALAGFGGAVGVANLKGTRVGTNLVWTPVKGFDIGAEFMYVNSTQSRPVGLATDAVLTSVGLPAYRGSTNEYEGRLRVQRAF